MKVLLVDDDDGARLTLQALLEDEGFDVVDVSTADHARRRFRDPDVRLVLLDEHIGTALGSALVPEIRAAAPRAYVVIVSGSADHVASAADGFFPKGGAFIDLLALVRRLLADER